MRFTTLDAFTLDLFSGRAENLKCGAAPTYMQLNGRWTILPGTALPIGLAEEDELGDAVPAADERRRYRGYAPRTA